jgi:hypothetical protein
MLVLLLVIILILAIGGGIFISKFLFLFSSCCFFCFSSAPSLVIESRRVRGCLGPASGIVGNAERCGPPAAHLPLSAVALCS